LHARQPNTQKAEASRPPGFLHDTPAQANDRLMMPDRNQRCAVQVDQ
jgi:hypothetical protein